MKKEAKKRGTGILLVLLSCVLLFAAIGPSPVIVLLSGAALSCEKNEDCEWISYGACHHDESLASSRSLLFPVLRTLARTDDVRHLRGACLDSAIEHGSRSCEHQRCVSKDFANQ